MNCSLVNSVDGSKKQICVKSFCRKHFYQWYKAQEYELERKKDQPRHRYYTVYESAEFDADDYMSIANQLELKMSKLVDEEDDKDEMQQDEEEAKEKAQKQETEKKAEKKTLWWLYVPVHRTTILLLEL